jgi:hypothetical protein
MNARKCKTPGAVYHVSQSGNVIRLAVSLPSDVEIPHNEWEQLKDRFHDAAEKLLAPYWTGKEKP